MTRPVNRVGAPRPSRARIWELRPERLAEAGRHLDRISRRWDEPLGRPRALVER